MLKFEEGERLMISGNSYQSVKQLRGIAKI
jgi:hypothetical protein